MNKETKLGLTWMAITIAGQLIYYFAFNSEEIGSAGFYGSLVGAIIAGGIIGKILAKKNPQA